MCNQHKTALQPSHPSESRTGQPFGDLPCQRCVPLYPLRYGITDGSFGMAGDNVDRGFTFHVPGHWLEAGGLHLVADDEHRHTFNLQAIVDGQDDAHPVDRSTGRVEEMVLPGAHSDVGGGYAAGEISHELARVALEKMYEAAHVAGTPIDRSTIQSDVERNAWNAGEALLKDHRELMNYYRNQNNLRLHHRRWRVLNVARDLTERDLQQPGAGSSTQREMRRRLRLFKNLQMIEDAQKDLEEGMRACFDNKSDYRNFCVLSQRFYATWCHKSHNPYSAIPGMYAGTYQLERRRRAYSNRSVDMANDKEFKIATPRSYPDCVWVDVDCLGSHPI